MSAGLASLIGLALLALCVAGVARAVRRSDWRYIASPPVQDSRDSIRQHVAILTGRRK